MAVSRTLRFQVLRRDGHACSYCGARAPDARLTVDHVIPVALGGSDEPDNLTTACTDCNGGKAAAPADAAIVDAVAANYQQYMQVMHELAERDASIEPDCGWFEEVWCSYTDRWGAHPYLPDNWQSSIRTWIARGLTRNDITTAAERALRVNIRERDAEFRYMAGTLWRILTAREEEARRIIDDTDQPDR